MSCFSSLFYGQELCESDVELRASNFVLSLLLGFVGDIPVILAKPQTYMNLTGESVIFSSCSEYDILKVCVDSGI